MNAHCPAMLSVQIRLSLLHTHNHPYPETSQNNFHDVQKQAAYNMSYEPNPLLTGFIQIAGLTAVIIFGIFSALSWSEAVKASYDTAAANVIAMVTLCSSQVGACIPDLLALRCRNLTVV